MTTTQTQIRETVTRISRVYGADIAVHWAYGRPRVTTKDEARDISPRLPMREMGIWLEGFEAGLEAKRPAAV